MKIEKISDTQIRCTLNKTDLIDRQLRISELAYGTDKAKALFRDMMQQANCEFGFEADDIPLMIEAIPVSPECLILVITKIDDPDELDTRFSRFTASEDGDEIDEDADSYADEILNCFDQFSEIMDDNDDDNIIDVEDFTPLSETLSAVADTIGTGDESTVRKTNKTKPVSPQVDLVKIFSFASLNEIIHLSKQLHHVYKGENTVYKDSVNSRYFLVLHKSKHSPEEFNKICNIISEFGKTERVTYASPSYYEEHFETIIKKKAIQVLSKM